MKLKKIIVLFTTVCILGGLVACGKDTANEVNEENTNIQNDEIVTGGESNDDVASDSEQITMEALMEHEVTPASDFVCMGDETTGAIISRYEGTDEIVVIPDTIDGLPVTVISSYTFGTNSNVKAVKISDSVTTIEELAFGTNENLEIVVLGSSVETIGTGAFIQCSSLKEIRLNEGLKTIHDQAFVGCDQITELYIPDSVETIEFPIAWDITLCGKKGSAAEQYTLDNEWAYFKEVE